VEAWQQQTTGGFALEILPGGHFLLTAQRDTIVERIAEDLASG